jgi:hypothetical protein
MHVGVYIFICEFCTFFIFVCISFLVMDLKHWSPDEPLCLSQPQLLMPLLGLALVNYLAHSY